MEKDDGRMLCRVVAELRFEPGILLIVDRVERGAIDCDKVEPVLGKRVI